MDTTHLSSEAPPREVCARLSNSDRHLVFAIAWGSDSNLNIRLNGTPVSFTSCTARNPVSPHSIRMFMRLSVWDIDWGIVLFHTSGHKSRSVDGTPSAVVLNRAPTNIMGISASSSRVTPVDTSTQCGWNQRAPSWSFTSSMGGKIISRNDDTGEGSSDALAGCNKPRDRARATPAIPAGTPGSHQQQQQQQLRDDFVEAAAGRSPPAKCPLTSSPPLHAYRGHASRKGCLKVKTMQETKVRPPGNTGNEAAGGRAQGFCSLRLDGGSSVLGRGHRHISILSFLRDGTGGDTVDG